MEDVMQNPDKYNYLDDNLKEYTGDNQQIKKQVLELLDL